MHSLYTQDTVWYVRRKISWNTCTCVNFMKYSLTLETCMVMGDHGNPGRMEASVAAFPSGRRQTSWEAETPPVCKNILRDCRGNECRPSCITYKLDNSSDAEWIWTKFFADTSWTSKTKWLGFQGHRVKGRGINSTKTQPKIRCRKGQIPLGPVPRDFLI